MRTHRFGTLAAVAAILAAGALARAESGEKDGHAEDDWHGVATWDPKEGGAAATGDPDPSLSPVPAGSGTATPSTGGTTGDVGSGTGSPSPDPGAGPLPGPTPTLASCGARWVLEVTPETPRLHEKETLLTLELFRVDAFGFLSNGYCRSESTWFADWFSTTKASRTENSAFRVILRLQGECAGCGPRIDHLGLSTLEARAQTRASTGSITTGTKADASASTTWAGDVDCSSATSAAARDGNGSSVFGLDFCGVKIQVKESESFVLAVGFGGKGAQKTVDRNRTEMWIRHTGSVATDAAGIHEDSQAKVLAGYDLKLRGESKCGAFGEYTVTCVK